MSGLLIYTTGDTDVQLVENGQRWELKRDIAQEFSRQHGWSVVSSDIPKADPKEKKGIPKEGPFQVCTPKLDAILHYLRGQNIAIERALLLYTDRPTQPNGRQDPYHVIPVLEHRLSQEHIEPYSVTYLSAGDLEGAPEGPAQDSALQRSVAQCIERAIAQHLSQTSDDVVIAVLGGHPVIREVVDELVPLHARGRQVLHLRLPDLSRTTPTTPSSEAASSGYLEKPARYTPSSPSATISARRHALTLIEKGNFVAAWGAVAHLEQEPSCQRWVQALRWLYQWATSQPIDEACDVPIINETTGAAAVALRVEQALVNGEFHRAISNTSAFFEELVWAHLRSGYVTDSGQRTDKGEPLYFVTPEPPRTDGFPRPRQDPRGRVPARVAAELSAQSQPRRICNFGKGHGAILTYLVDNSEPARRHTPGICATHALARLAPMAEQVQGERNNTAHSEPDRDQLHAATDTFRTLHLWTPDNHFLSAPLVAAALREINVDDPEHLFDNLVAAVRDRLINAEPLPVQ